MVPVRSIRWTCLGVLVAVMSCASPVAAMAGWPLDGGRQSACLGFGASYRTADGSSATHRGVDIAADPGQTVSAPLAGTVRFAGRIPASGGGTTFAVTLQTAAGDVTLLPLSQSEVTRGQELAQGEPVGAVAEEGDASFSGTHLHVGLRTGSLYLDPSLALGVPPQATQGAEPEPPVAEAAAPAASEGIAGAGARGPVTTTGEAPVVQGSPAAAIGAGARVESTDVGVAPAVASPQGAVAAGQTELAPGVTLAANATPLEAAGALPSVALKVDHVLAAGGGVAKSASKVVLSAGPGAAFSRIAALAHSGARVLVMAGIALLAALAALWPLWRHDKGEGTGKVSVSVVGDNVAAVASR